MTRVLHRVSWIGLAVVGAFLLFAVAADLTADRRTGLPSDHTRAFSAMAGQSFDAVRTANPGVAGHITARRSSPAA